MNHIGLEDFGLYSLLIAIHTWIFTISDSFALQSLIQFGMKEENRKHVNLISLIIHILLTMSVSLIIFTFKDTFAHLFNENRIKEIGSILPLLSLAFIPRSYCQKIIYRMQNMKYLFFVNLLFFGTITTLILVKISQTKNLYYADLSYYYLIGSALSSVLAIILTRKELRFKINGNTKLTSFFDFGWQMTTTSLLFTLPRLLDIVFIKLFLNIDLRVIGLYSAAKNLFRVFDEAMSAISGLIYPSAAKQISKQNDLALNDLLTKATSFMFFTFAILDILLICGFSNLIFKHLLPLKFMESQNYFNLMLIGALFLPFTFIYSIMVALDRLKRIIVISFFGNIVFFMSLYILGISNSAHFIALPLIIYYLYLGITGLYMSHNIIKASYGRMIFRGYNDVYNFIKKYTN